MDKKAGVFLWGWDSTNSKWVRVAVTAAGVLKITAG